MFLIGKIIARYLWNEIVQEINFKLMPLAADPSERCASTDVTLLLRHESELHHD